MSYQHRSKNQPFVNADINKSTNESYLKEDNPNYMILVNWLALHWNSLEWLGESAIILFITIYISSTNKSSQYI
jgi:hypothetical protein